MAILKRYLILSILAAFSFMAVLNAKNDIARPKIGDHHPDQLRAPWVGYVSGTEGKVMIKRHNSDGTAILAIFEAKDGDLIHEKDVLEVNAKSSAQIVLKNGTEISLGPGTTFKIYQHYVDEQEQNSLFNLLSGNARVNIKDEIKRTSVKLYAPNVVVSASRADFATKYDNDKKSAMVACLDGEISVVGMTDNKERNNYAQDLVTNEYMDIRTSYEGEREVYVNTDPAEMTKNYKRQVLESFNANYKETDPNELARIGTSFFAHSAGF